MLLDSTVCCARLGFGSRLGSVGFFKDPILICLMHFTQLSSPCSTCSRTRMVLLPDAECYHYQMQIGRCPVNRPATGIGTTLRGDQFKRQTTALHWDYSGTRANRRAGKGETWHKACSTDGHLIHSSWRRLTLAALPIDF